MVGGELSGTSTEARTSATILSRLEGFALHVVVLNVSQTININELLFRCLIYDDVFLGNQE